MYSFLWKKFYIGLKRKKDACKKLSYFAHFFIADVFKYGNQMH